MNSTACDACPIGSYSGAGASLCSLCTIGKISSVAATPTCVSCIGGQYTNMTNGGSHCYTCGSGSYSVTGSSSCTICNTAFGEWQPFAGRTSCVTCSGYNYYNGTSCVIAEGSLVNSVASLATLTESSIQLFWTPPTDATTSTYYALQLVGGSGANAAKHNWPLITVRDQNFTFFGLLPSTLYSCVMLTIPIGGTLYHYQL